MIAAAIRDADMPAKNAAARFRCDERFSAEFIASALSRPLQVKSKAGIFTLAEANQKEAATIAKSADPTFKPTDILL